MFIHTKLVTLFNICQILPRKHDSISWSKTNYYRTPDMKEKYEAQTAFYSQQWHTKNYRHLISLITSTWNRIRNGAPPKRSSGILSCTSLTLQKKRGHDPVPHSGWRLTACSNSNAFSLESGCPQTELDEDTTSGSFV